MNYITVGTIGHVDHGKTSLVKALTGIDTDRLKEEKERGLSISLGYANLELPDGEVGFVDAPGHEKFIRTMIAGATAIEAVLLVVDVNEGVKPQTQEHLDIADLLGIDKGIIVVTKCDAALPGRLDEIEEDLQILTLDTFLEDAPVLFTSSTTGQGLDDLKGRLNEIVASAEPAPDEGYAYLPIDRVFIMSGFGTVVTGTLRRGGLKLEDEVEIFPQRLKANVRELQTHNRSVEGTAPGLRTAVNLRGVEKAEIVRGDVVATPGSVDVTSILDVELRMLKDAPRPLKHRQMVRVLFGTKETYARAHLLGRDEVAPGETAALQLKLEETVAPLNLEPFIIRTYSPMTTIGGGRILGTAARGYKRKDPGALTYLETLASGDPETALSAIIERHGEQGIPLAKAARQRRMSTDEARKRLSDQPVVFVKDELLIHKDVFERVCERFLNTLRDYHEKHPTEAGLAKTELDISVPPILLEAALEHLSKQKQLEIAKGVVRIAGFTPEGALTDAQQRLAEEIEEAYKKAGLKTPPVAEVLNGRKDGENILKFLIDQGLLVPIHTDARNRSYTNALMFHRNALTQAKRKVAETFPDSRPFSVPEFKDLLGVSRKYAIPLLEYFDRLGFTKRVGDERVVTGVP